MVGQGRKEGVGERGGVGEWKEGREKSIVGVFIVIEWMHASTRVFLPRKALSRCEVGR